MVSTIRRQIGLALVFVFFMLGGIAHFVFADAEIGIIPQYVPYPVQVNYITGAFELLGAAGLLWHHTRRAAGYGLMLLTICVTPANVFMLQHADRYPDLPLWVLVTRLPAQALLVALIYWSSRVDRRAIRSFKDR